MKMSKSSAASASRMMSHMLMHKGCRPAVGLMLTILGLLSACAAAPPQSPAPVEARPAARVVAIAPPQAPAEPARTRTRARWVAADWAELPGWDEDRPAAAWPALRNSCLRPAAGWAELCARIVLDPPSDDDAARRWLMQWLQPYRVEAAEGDNTGLLTGYFEPTVTASRKPRAGFRVPLLAPPPDLAIRRPYWTRQQLDSLPAAVAGMRGLELAWIEDPLDLLLLQIQGSGRLLITEPDGRRQTIRVAFAGHNDQPYRSVGRWLVDRGELPADGVSWPAIKAWAARNPWRVNELLWSNPRVVFFREEPLPDLNVGPRGAMGVPLVPGRSIAVDPASVPFGTPVWLDTTEPLSSTPLRRLAIAHDTGGAIVGAVRADYFWGWGEAAEAQAGRMKQALRWWALWPRGATVP